MFFYLSSVLFLFFSSDDVKNFKRKFLIIWFFCFVLFFGKQWMIIIFIMFESKTTWMSVCCCCLSSSSMMMINSSGKHFTSCQWMNEMKWENEKDQCPCLHTWARFHNQSLINFFSFVSLVWFSYIWVRKMSKNNFIFPISETNKNTIHHHHHHCVISISRIGIELNTTKSILVVIINTVCVWQWIELNWVFFQWSKR